jgi:hypothetical protein
MECVRHITVDQFLYFFTNLYLLLLAFIFAIVHTYIVNTVHM